ncbi:MAG: T9SS type A sorting domain-containing protein [Tangfeifania sp.]
MKKFTFLFVLIVMVIAASAQTEITIKDEDLNGDATWTNDNVYLLDGFVFLEEGTLTIEAGTVIKGKKNPTTGDNASALIITKYAKINAVGTPDMPIIFTAEADDVNDPTDLDETDRGEWGGVILLGDATLGFNTETSQIEGIPTDEPKANFGGDNDSHNAGVMKYVSIRHGGAQLEPDKEINGLTFGGVGSETVIEHIEVYANDDDGFEWFGGTVSCKWLVSAFNKDDAFDYDYGWRGNGQFWFAVQAEDLSDNGGEHDGAKDDDRTPFSKPTIYNATYIGSGVDNTTAKNSTALHFRDNAGGIYANSIFTDFAKHAIEVEDLSDGIDSRRNMENGDLALKNNIWYGFGAGSELNAGENGIIRPTENAQDPDAGFLVDHLTNNSNSLEDPMLRGISRTTDGGLDPLPKAGSPVYNNLAERPDDNWFLDAPYKGAFNSKNWAKGWTAVDANGYFGEVTNEVIVKDEDLNGDATWTNDNVYLLDGFVFLEEGTLTIEAGTVIKGKKNPTTGDNASALIITKYAKINAVGTPDMPIIFTAEADDVNDPTDLDETDRGEWGGVILLGDATLGFNTETSQIEGIPTDEPKANFGGDNDSHNAGVMKYVSIRHGGAQLEPDKEINGLTFGGVGSETVIEHIEVYANDDDGFEWFGGTVSCKWLVSAFNKDDAFDYDYGWRGNGQFWFAVQAEDLSDNGGEHDGAKDDDRTPFSKPTIYNATYIGSGVDNTTAKNSTALHFRDNAGGIYANSIFTDFAKHAIEVEDLSDGIDSRRNMENGDLALKNNIWYGFGAGSELNAGENGIIRPTENAQDPDAGFLVDHLTNNSNSIQDPVLRGISRTTNNGLDPRPHSHSPAFTVARAATPSDWFTTTNYIGAFGETNWAKHWTATDANGYFGDFVTDAQDIDFGIPRVKIYPNPTSGNATIALELDGLSRVDVSLFDITGKLVQVVAKDQVLSGNQNLSVSNLKNGMYIVRTIIDEKVNTEKLIVK